MAESRTNDQATFNPSLHGLRGMAALLVLGFHWSQTFTVLPQTMRNFAGGNINLALMLDFGWLGVLLFFVLSGYLLGGNLAQHKMHAPTIRRFWFRRFCRIYPAVWIQFAVLMLLGGAIKGLTPPPDLLDSVKNFFLLINIPPHLPRAINLVWWTLPIELTFYMCLPLIVTTQRRIGWIWMLLLALVISATWRAGVMFVNRDLEHYMPVHPIIDLLPGVLFTFIAGYALVFIPQGLNKYQRLALLITALLTLYLLTKWLLSNIETYWTGHWMLAVWNPLASIPIAIIVYCCLKPTPLTGFLKSRFMVWLGHVSYGIYLWHFPVLVVLNAYMAPQLASIYGSVAALGIILFLTLILAQLSYTFIEKPAMQWRRKTIE